MASRKEEPAHPEPVVIPRKQWLGFEDDDVIAVVDPDETIYRRDGVWYVVKHA